MKPFRKPRPRELYRGCVSKRRYRSEADARDSAKLVRRSRGVETRPYECPICDGWHLTSKGAGG